MKKTFLFALMLIIVSALIFSCKKNTPSEPPVNTATATATVIINTATATVTATSTDEDTATATPTVEDTATATPTSYTELTTVFQQGVMPFAAYAGVNDTYLMSTTDFDNAGCVELRTVALNGPENERFLVKFDISSIIPATATVISASLHLYFNQDIIVPAYMEMYKLTTDWGAGNDCWSAAAAGECNWTDAIKGTTAWTTPGGDYVTPGILGVNASGSDTSDLYLSLTGTGLIMVQDWVSNPSTNYGVIFKIADETTASNLISFHSSESASSVLRPKLVVTFRN
jgi:hypothetical protein